MTNHIYISEYAYFNGEGLKELLHGDTCIQVFKYSEIPDRLAFYQKAINEAFETPFIIELDKSVCDGDIIWLIRIFFCNNYFKKNNRIVIVSSVSNPGIQQHFEQHGFAEAIILDLSKLPPFNIGRIFGYVSKLENEAGWDLFITHFSEANHGSNLPESIFENSSIHEQLIAARKENGILKWEIDKQKQELANCQTYLEIALKQKETEYILNFYHKQYEVLPLWYKRFGHLLKLIMGKRKFKGE